MILDHYFKFEKLDLGKTKTRFDLTAFSDPVYDMLNIPQGKPFIYYCQASHYIKSRSERKADMAIGNKTGHVSSVYIPNIEKPCLAHGDIKGTQDAILFGINEKIIEIFIAKGKKAMVLHLYNLYFDGELDREIERLREHSKPFFQVV